MQIWRFLSWILMFCLFLGPFLQAQTAWDLRKEDEGIRIYTRSNEGFKLKEYKAISTIKAPVDEVVKLFKKPAQIASWLDGCSTSNLLKHVSENEFVVYFVNPAPWPVSDRDNIIIFRFLKESEGVVRVEFTGKKDFIPEKSSLVRIPYTRGHWEFSTNPDGHTDVYYQVQADPGGNIPGWLANSTVVDSPFKTIRNLKRTLE